MKIHHEKQFKLINCKFAITLLTLCLLAATTCKADGKQQIKPPIEKEGLLKALRRSVLTKEELIAEVKSSGVDFRLTASDEQKIRAAGRYLGQKGLDDLLAAVRSNYKILILIVEFQNLDMQRHAVTEIIINQLRLATNKYSDMRIEYLSEPITAQQGDEVARRKGRERGAHFVIWGWYSVSSVSVYANVHFVFVKGPESWALSKKSEEETFKSPLIEINDYSLQTKITEHMTYLTLFTTALARLEAQDIDSAIERFDSILNLQNAPEQIIDPAEIYRYRAYSFLLKGNYDKAIDDCNKAISHKPTAWSYATRGAANDGKGNYDLAIDDYTKAIKLAPRLIYAFLNRGVLYDKTGKDDLAIDDFNTVITLDPEAEKGFLNRGATYVDMGKDDLAIDDFTKAITLNPDYAAAYFNRGVLYHKKNKNDLAIADFTKAIKLNLNHPPVYYKRGEAYFGKGKSFLDLAINDFNTIITLDPKASAYFARGLCYYFKDKFDLAIADYTAAITLDPNDLRAYFARGKIYETNGQIDLAIKDYSQGIELDRTFAAAYFFRGQLQQKKGYIDLAIKDYSQAIELDSNDARFYFARGLAYVRLSDTRHAILDLNKTLQLSNDAELRQKAEQELKRITVK